MGRRSSSQGCVATGNQGASCSRRPRPLGLPLNPLECGFSSYAEGYGLIACSVITPLKPQPTPWRCFVFAPFVQVGEDLLQRILEEFLRNRPIAIALAPIRIDFIEFFLGYGANGISDKTFLGKHAQIVIA